MKNQYSQIDAVLEVLSLDGLPVASCMWLRRALKKLYSCNKGRRRSESIAQNDDLLVSCRTLGTLHPLHFPSYLRVDVANV
ncbi:hypothetical protein EVAR_31977_1 [Eumeta japonica]|uniref:Uncharacterized protein n=1 Tax=Eumeta variegata TaxID=151549 RepID=A0A4C1VT20_EUMVA|nr:hypothetical protein EVAR_31977_1 [Eumeta japonica]